MLEIGVRNCVHSVSNNKDAALSDYSPFSQCMVLCIIQDMLPAGKNTPKIAVTEHDQGIFLLI